MSFNEQSTLNPNIFKIEVARNSNSQIYDNNANNKINLQNTEQNFQQTNQILLSKNLNKNNVITTNNQVPNANIYIVNNNNYINNHCNNITAPGPNNQIKLNRPIKESLEILFLKIKGILYLLQYPLNR